MAFESLTDRLAGVFKKLRGHGKLTEADIKAAMREVRMALLEADVNYKVAKEFCAKVSERAMGQEVMESLTPAQQVVKIVNEELVALMGGSEAARLNIKNKGQTVIMLCGLQGAGKTTMVNLLMKFYPLGGGEIRIDGVPLSQMTREHVHDLFGMVLQDTWLFEGSIRDNLCYGKEGITDEQLDQVTRATGLYHLIHTLPEGYDTQLSDKLNLSAGQKQLMTIARAMIENAPMLILDEATSSVDTRTEMLIQQAMDTLTKGRTSFVIAHRLSTIKNADKILVMRHGDIIESGTHEELLQKGGFYAELYNSQFEQA